MAEHYPEAEIKTSKTAYTVWLLPFIALILAISLIYKNVNQAGVIIYVEFPDANGIIAKKTPVKFRGVEVGRVRSLTPLPDGSGILATVEMQKDAEPYLTDKLKFWLVKPTVDFSGISGLETLLSGAYIQVDSGKNITDGNATRYFKALMGAPAVSIPDELEVFTLVSSNASGVTNGSLIYHRNIVVGEVRHVKLSDDHQAVEVTVTIHPEFKGLVKLSSRFWSISGLKASFGLGGMQVQTGGFVPMLVGGIAFSSPPNSPQAQEYTQFRLYPDAESARDSLEIELTFSPDAPVSVGTAIMFDKQKVGMIGELNWNKDFKSLTGKAKLSVEMSALMRKDTRFWLESPELSPKHIDVGQLWQGTIIRLSPGSDSAQPQANHFAVSNLPPKHDASADGLRLRLTADDAAGLSKGSGIYYKSQLIGKVEWVDFVPGAKLFQLDVLIYPRYVAMLNRRSLFYNLSGIEVKARLQELKLTVPSLQQLIAGGIGVHLEAGDYPPLDLSQAIPLYRDLGAAKEGLLGEAPVIRLRSKDLLFARVDAPLYYKEFEIGKVRQASLAADGSYSQIEIALQPKYRGLVDDNSRFWVKSMVDVKADMSGIRLKAQPLLSMLIGGIAMGRGERPMTSAGEYYSLFKDRDSAFDDTQAVHLTITRATTLKAGAPVKFRGYTVGKVTSTELLPDLSGISAEVRLQGRYADAFTKDDTRYWLVQPNIALNGVRNVESAVWGDHLAVTKGHDGRRLDFIVDKANLNEKDGLSIVLTADRLGSLNQGDPILYKQLRIGEVVNVGLSRDKQQLKITALVYPDYAQLVTVGSKFWQAGGIKIDAGLFSGVQVDTETLESIVAGGIAMATDVNSEAVAPGHRFILHAKAKDQWKSGTLVATEEN